MHIKIFVLAGLVAASPNAASAVTLLAAPDAAAMSTSTGAGVSWSSDTAAIRRKFDTVAGQSYLVEIAPGTDSGRGATVRTVLTTATGGVTQTSTFDTGGQSSGALGWQTYSYRFVAGGTATTMVFAAAEGRARAASLAPVSVAELPEPAIWAMMLFGFFGLSFAVRRRDGGPRARVRFS